MLRIQASVKAFKISTGNCYKGMSVTIRNISNSHANSCRWVLVVRFAAATPDCRWSYSKPQCWTL